MSKRYDRLELEESAEETHESVARRTGPGRMPDLSNETIEQLLTIDFDTKLEVEVDEGPGGEERRRVPERPQGTRSKSRFYRVLNTVVLFAESGVKGAAAVLAVLALSVALLAYSLIYRAGVVDSQTETMRELEMLTADVVGLRRQSAEQRLREVMISLSEADSRVFADYRQLSDWLADRFVHARQLGLSFEYRIGDAQELSVKRTAEVPITLSMRAGVNSPGDVYSSSLQMLRDLAESRWFVEIIGIHVLGDQGGVTSLDANIRVWVHNDAVTHEALAQ